MSWMQGLSLALAGAGTAIQVAGELKAGHAQQDAAEAAQRASEGQAEVSDYNAAVAELQAEDAVERGKEQESRYRTQVRGIIGRQRAALAANNVDVGYGSAVDVQADAAYLGELDALTIRTNAAREAWGYKVQAADYRNQARIQRQTGAFSLQAGQAAVTQSKYQAAGTILGTAASLLQARYGPQAGG